MIAGATSASDATTTLDGTNVDRTPSYKRLYNHHLNLICMPFIEWACVAGIPTLLLCIKIGLPTTVAADDDGAPSRTCDGIENVNLMQWTMPLLAITAVLSFIAILFFGDRPCCANDQAKSRGMGIVMGSHLIPLLYLAMKLSTVYGVGIATDSTSCASLQMDQRMHDSCQVKEKEYQTNMQMHLTFSSLGALAFVTSYIFSQYNHRRCNSKRGKPADLGKTGDNPNGAKKANRQKKVDSEISAMSICWRIYSLLIIFQSTMQSVLYDPDVCSPMLGVLHMLLIMVYDQRIVTSTQSDPTISRASWQDAFTPGEWMAVSTLITSLVGEYVLQYSSFEFNSELDSASVHSSIPLHLVVSHAGVVGCLVGVTLWSILETFLPRNVFTRNQGMVASFVLVIGVTLGCLEFALNSQWDESNAYYVATECKVADFIPSIIFCDNWIPMAVRWLLQFLSSEAAGIRAVRVPRFLILGYWAFILAVSLPAVSMITSWIDGVKTNDRDGAKMTDNAIGDRIIGRKQRVIIARKYFHLVAILLFTPITLLDPDMMTLSYAIAVALLCVLEMIRGCFFSKDDHKYLGRKANGTSWNQFFMIFLDEKDSSAANGGLAVTHISLIVGCAFPLLVSQLTQQSYKIAATCSLKSQPLPEPLSLFPLLGVLILGIGDSAGAICGMKFGRHRWPGGSSRTVEGSLCMFLSLIIAAAGVGALVLCFDESMNQWSIDSCNYPLHHMMLASAPLGIITFLEASTAQIDNLCLPIHGSMLVLMLTAGVTNY